MVKKKEPPKIGRPRHNPTGAMRSHVQSLAGFGIKQDDIAKDLGISKPTLIEHYRKELDTGAVKANAAVLNNLFRQATKDDPRAISAAIFWAKVRMGWYEKMLHEHSGDVNLTARMQNALREARGLPVDAVAAAIDDEADEQEYDDGFETESD